MKTSGFAVMFRLVLFGFCLTVALGLAARHANAQRGGAQAAAGQGNVQNGRRLYAAQNCAQCHGSEGQGGTAQIAGPRIGPPNLAQAAFIQTVRAPKTPMPPYAATAVSDAELADLYAYLKTIPAPPETTIAGNAENGKKLYRSAGCYECHNTEGQGAQTGPRLAPDPIQFSAFSRQVRNPVDQMPPYTAKVLPDAQLSDIYVFLRTIPKPPNAASIPLLQ